MKVTQGLRYQIIDDFLSEDDLSSLRSLASGLHFERRSSVVDPVADGDAHRSRGSLLQYEDFLGQGGYDAADMPRAYGEVVSALSECPQLLGRPGADWSVVGLTFWKYAAGNRLGWHNDTGTRRRGEFILFMHDTWRASWGGELLLLDRDPDELDESPARLSATEAVEYKVNKANEALVAIVPRPNRLVVVQEGTLHCIHRVDPTAGDNLRQTMTGFVASKPVPHRTQDEGKVERLAAILGSAS
jgi:Rps23 Pro-64 3,4-dihydroxylase Tpa1-like proline 4-hydroxylase